MQFLKGSTADTSHSMSPLQSLARQGHSSVEWRSLRMQLGGCVNTEENGDALQGEPDDLRDRGQQKGDEMQGDRFVL